MNQPDPATELRTLPFIDVIIVSFNHARFMEACITSLAHVDYPKLRWRIQVVINKDGDGTLEAVQGVMERYAGQLPELVIHAPHANLGFAGGNNMAITWSRQHGGEFVYCLNPDTEMDVSALREAMAVFLQYPKAGAVQSLLVRGDDPTQINSRGNALHFLGFGYCMGDHDAVSTAPTGPVVVGYPSGAGVLIPHAILNEIGMFDETLFAYHEDLDLGWRMMLAGHLILLAPKSRVTHHYEFSRSIEKWHWMERNRMIVLLKNYSLISLILLSPAILATEMAIWTFSVKGRWFTQKLKATWWFLKPSSWKYLFEGRQRIKRIRRIPDSLIFERMTWKIEYQELKSGLAERVANPLWKAMYASYRLIIR